LLSELIANTRAETANWVFWVSAAILGFGLLAILVVWIFWRRWLREQEEEGRSTEAWSLDDLRAMRDAGDLTDEEYEAAKQVIVNSYQNE
jgi:uncharacterized membrane protein